MPATPASTATEPTITLPPLTDQEAGALHTAVSLFRNVIDQATAYSDQVYVLRTGPMYDVRFHAMERALSRPSQDVNYYRPLTREEYRFILLSLDNLHASMGLLLTYGDVARDRDAVLAVKEKISHLAS
jgi:hypothetical protein